MSAYLCLPLLPYFDHIRSRMSLKPGDLDLQGQIDIKTSKILGLIFWKFNRLEFNLQT